MIVIFFFRKSKKKSGGGNKFVSTPTGILNKHDTDSIVVMRTCCEHLKMRSSFELTLKYAVNVRDTIKHTRKPILNL